MTQDKEMMAFLAMNTMPDLEAGYFDRLVEAGYFDRLVEAGYVDRLVEAGYVGRLVEAGYFDRLVEAGYVDRLVEAGYVDRLVKAFPVYKELPTLENPYSRLLADIKDKKRKFSQSTWGPIFQ